MTSSRWNSGAVRCFIRSSALVPAQLAAGHGVLDDRLDLSQPGRPQDAKLQADLMKWLTALKAGAELRLAAGS